MAAHKIAAELRQILDTAEDETPPFLRGVLLTPAQFNYIYGLLDTIEEYEKNSSKYWKDVDATIKYGNQLMGHLLRETIENAERDPIHSYAIATAKASKDNDVYRKSLDVEDEGEANECQR